MSKPIASFLLAQVLVAGVVVLTLFMGTTPRVVAGGQTTPTPGPTPTTGPTPTPIGTATPVPTATPGPTPTPGLPTTVTDSYTTGYITLLDVPPPGVLANDLANGGGAMTAVLVSTTSRGALSLNPDGSFSYTPNTGVVGTDSFRYRAQTMYGAGNIVTNIISVQDPTNVQPPFNLYPSSIEGNRVTFRWYKPQIGPTPTGFTLEGGVLPNQVLASIPTGSPFEIFTVDVPNGSWLARMHSTLGSDQSAASNEIPIHVNVPVPPANPYNLVGLADGSNLTLAWVNNFDGGPPASLLLDVTGSATATLPMGFTDTFTFNPVPNGTYGFRVRAANAAGVSAPSNTVSLSFPGSCSGPPFVPVGFLAYNVGNTISVVWDPFPAGPAPTVYELYVAGAFSGTFPTTGRALSGTVGPGTYNLSVAATNPCGTSSPSQVQSITIP